MLQGQNIADAPISVGSLDPCFSCTERMGVIDQDSGEVRIYRREELTQMSRAARKNEIASLTLAMTSGSKKKG